MNGSRFAAVVLIAVAAFVLLVTSAYPPGTHGVPGPALVPRVLGVALAMVGVLVLRTPGQAAPPLVRHQLAIPATILLLVLYAALWRLVPFGVLTGAVLVTFLRLTGVHWRGAVIAAALMAGALQALFERALGVRF